MSEAVMFWDAARSRWTIRDGSDPSTGNIYHYQSTSSDCPDGGVWVDTFGDPVVGFLVVEGTCP